MFVSSPLRIYINSLFSLINQLFITNNLYAKTSYIFLYYSIGRILVHPIAKAPGPI